MGLPRPLPCVGVNPTWAPAWMFATCQGDQAVPSQLLSHWRGEKARGEVGGSGGMVLQE